MKYLKHKRNLNYRQGMKIQFYSKIYLSLLNSFYTLVLYFLKLEKGLNVYIPKCIGILLSKMGRKKVDIYLSPIAIAYREGQTNVRASKIMLVVINEGIYAWRMATKIHHNTSLAGLAIMLRNTMPPFY